MNAMRVVDVRVCRKQKNKKLKYFALLGAYNCQYVCVTQMKITT